MIKHIIFDWDGTLADTYPSILAAYNYAFDRLEMPRMSEQELVKLAGQIQNKNMFEYIFKDKKDEAKVFFYEHINKHHTDNIKATNGAIELLEFCIKNNIKCYLLSSKTNKTIDLREPYLTKEINKLGMMKYFTKVVGAGETIEEKPSLIAINALFNNQLPNSSETLVIGDGIADVEVAQTLNTKVIIYDFKQAYTSPKPTYKIDSLNKAIEIIKRENKI